MARRVDLNRIKKIYPYVRRKPIYRFVGETKDSARGNVNAEIETVEISLNNRNSYRHNFLFEFSDVPKVVAISKNDNINVYVETVTKQYVTIKASANSNEKAFIHAINVQ